MALVGTLGPLVTACSATSRHYERVGMSGAGLVLAGLATSLVAHSTIPPQNEAGLRATTTTAISLQAAGFVMVIYALDGVIRVTSETPAWQP